jgi:hypothetical protein
MANEITFSGSLTASKNGASVAASASVTNDMSGDQLYANVQAVGTSAEQIDISDVSTIGLIYVKNLDATNYVEIALDSGMTNVFIKLLAGEFNIFSPATATLYARANTSGINLQVIATEL